MFGGGPFEASAISTRILHSCGDAGHPERALVWKERGANRNLSLPFRAFSRVGSLVNIVDHVHWTRRSGGFLPSFSSLVAHKDQMRRQFTTVVVVLGFASLHVVGWTGAIPKPSE